jgi:hypothetical protein
VLTFKSPSPAARGRSDRNAAEGRRAARLVAPAAEKGPTDGAGNLKVNTFSGCVTVYPVRNDVA